jgi:hypothetical protein
MSRAPWQNPRIVYTLLFVFLSGAAAMETVLDDFVTYYQTLQAQMDDVRATGKQRILRILKDDQKQKFEKMIGELQNKPLR